MTINKRIFPSLLGANPLTLLHTIESLSPYCPGYHIDLMDFHCVPNLGIGTHTASAIILQLPTQYHWLHLMTQHPQNIMPIILQNMKSKPKLMATFHIECCRELSNATKCFHEFNIDFGIAIKPKTDVSALEPYLHKMHHALIMSVNPGRSGQPFLKDTMQRIFQLSQLRSMMQLNFRIGVDGGINENNIVELAQAGADDFAIATGIFRATNCIEKLQQLAALISM